MYDNRDLKQEPKVKSDAEDVAISMANSIDRYDFDEQMKMISIIREKVAERLNINIEKAEKHLVFMKDILKRL